MRVIATKWIYLLPLLFLLLGTALFGQVKVEVGNRSAGSVTLSAGVDTRTAQTVLSAAALSVALPILPYSALVSNSGPSTAVLFVISFDFIGADGRPSKSRAIRDFRQSEPKLRPGSSQVIDPAGWLARYLAPSPVAAPDPRENFLDHSDKIKNLSLMRISLDAVLFDNGQFMGPDPGDIFGDLSEENALTSALFNEMLIRVGDADGQLVARLDQIAATAQNEANNMKTISAGRNQLRLAAQAANLKRILQRDRSTFNRAVAAYHEPALWKESAK